MLGKLSARWVTSPTINLFCFYGFFFSPWLESRMQKSPLHFAIGETSSNQAKCRQPKQNPWSPSLFSSGKSQDPSTSTAQRACANLIRHSTLLGIECTSCESVRPGWKLSAPSLEGWHLASHSCCQDVLDSGSATRQKVINKIKASQRNGGLKMQDRNFI